MPAAGADRITRCDPDSAARQIGEMSCTRPQAQLVSFRPELDPIPLMPSSEVISCTPQGLIARFGWPNRALPTEQKTGSTSLRISMAFGRKLHARQMRRCDRRWRLEMLVTSSSGTVIARPSAQTSQQRSCRCRRQPCAYFPSELDSICLPRLLAFLRRLGRLSSTWSRSSGLHRCSQQLVAINFLEA